MSMFGTSRSVIGNADATIQKSVEEVFDFVAYRFFENYQKWAPEVAELEPLTEGQIHRGTRIRQLRADQGQPVESTFIVNDFLPCMRLSISGESDPYRCSYDFDAPKPQTVPYTQMSFTYELLELELFMRPFEKLIRITIQEGTERTVNNIKQLIESREIYT